MSEVDHKLHREMKAAAAFKDAIKVTCGEDDEAMRDMIEGETSLHEMIERVMLSMDEDEILVTGTSERIAELEARRDRFKKRIEAKRAMIEQAMVIGEIQKMERPCFTLSLRAVPPKTIVSDESLIPSTFWAPQAPNLDKKALGAALKEGEKIPGASLSNGGVSVTIRKK